MSFKDDTFWSILDRYVAGECSAMEVAEVHDWLASIPEDHELLLADVRRVRSVVKQRPVLQSADAAWRKAREELENGLVRGDGARHFNGIPLERPDRTIGKRWTGIGFFKTQPLRGWVWPLLVTITLVAGGIIAVWNTSVRHIHRAETVSLLTYTTANKQRANITLPDGSTVVLNVASRLDVPADYATGHHTVRLVGEALFTVNRHEGVPFIVNAGSATARVLGTSFLVRHYPVDTTVTIAVLDGKVSVRSVVLTAARQVVIDPAGTMHVGPADLTPVTFTNGILTFNGVPLREAVGMLDRWFDTDIRLHDSTLGAQKITGGFPSGSLAELTESLESAFAVRVVREGRVLTVYPK